jgi:hypothetical protein
MQPMPTPAHPGPMEPDGPGPDFTPVHGTAIPSQRHVLAANPITEATTEMPLIVPNSIDRPGPSPLPPIATQLLGGVAPPPTAAPQADTDTEPDTDSPQAGTESVDDSGAGAVAGDRDTVEQDPTQQDPAASVPEPGGEGQEPGGEGLDGEPGSGPSSEQSATAGADSDDGQAVTEAEAEQEAEA